MRMPGYKTARNVARKIRSRLRGRGIILGYHRIADNCWDPFDLAVRPENFSQQLEILRLHSTPITLGGLLDSLDGVELESTMVALTFDDGYLDCLSTVKPMLEQFAVPATVFVVTGWLGRELWWDLLARMLNPSRSLPDRLELTSRGEQHAWRLDRYPGAEGRKLLTWELYRLLARLSPGERASLLGEIEGSLAFTAGKDPEDRCLSRTELAQLTAGGLVDAGAHTENHEPLDRLSPTERRVEIESSKAVLEEILGLPVQGFSYPHGSLDQDTRQLVRQAGFAYACSSRPDVVLPKFDVFDLPRLWVPNVDGVGFRRWLGNWAGSRSGL